MSNHGIGLVFTPGPGGRPHVLLLQDVEAHCALCGYAHHERFYVGTPFHALTLARLRQLAGGVSTGLAASCAQCGADVTPAEAVRWQTHFGFPGAVGLVSAYAYDGAVQAWELSPHDRMDVQLIPRGAPIADASTRVFPDVTEAHIVSVFGHTFNGKARVRAWLLDAKTDRTRPLVLAPGLLVLADAAPLDRDAVVSRVPWLSNVPLQIATLVTNGVPVTGYPHAAAEWLTGLADAQLPAYLVCVCVYGDPPDVDVPGVAAPAERVVGGNWEAIALPTPAAVPPPTGATDDDPACVSRVAEAGPDNGPAMRTARAVLATFSIQVEVHPLADQDFWLRPPWASDPSHAPTFDVAAIAMEAARTVTPLAWIVHLEIDRLTLYLTGLVGEEYSDAALAAQANGAGLVEPIRA